MHLTFQGDKLHDIVHCVGICPPIAQDLPIEVRKPMVPVQLRADFMIDRSIVITRRNGQELLDRIKLARRRITTSQSGLVRSHADHETGRLGFAALVESKMDLSRRGLLKVNADTNANASVVTVHLE